MSIEHRNGAAAQYYFRAERRNGKVVRTYVGRLDNPTVDVIYRLDRSRIALHQLNLGAERNDDSAEHDRLILAYDVRSRLILSISRKLPIMKPPSKYTHTPRFGTQTQRPPSKEEFFSLVGRAEAGNKVAFKELSAILDRHEELWRPLGDLGRLVESHLIGVAASESLLQKMSIERFVQQLRGRLLADGDSPLEALLVHRIIVTHLDTTIRQLRADAAVSEASIRRRQRQLDQAQRRQVESIKALQEYRLATENFGSTTPPKSQSPYRPRATKKRATHQRPNEAQP